MSIFNLYDFLYTHNLLQNQTIVKNPHTNTDIMFLTSSFKIGRFTLVFKVTEL